MYSSHTIAGTCNSNRWRLQSTSGEGHMKGAWRYGTCSKRSSFRDGTDSVSSRSRSPQRYSAFSLSPLAERYSLSENESAIVANLMMGWVVNRLNSRESQGLDHSFLRRSSVTSSARDSKRGKGSAFARRSHHPSLEVSSRTTSRFFKLLQVRFSNTIGASFITSRKLSTLGSCNWTIFTIPGA